MITTKFQDNDDDSDVEMDWSDLCLENYVLETQVSESDNEDEEKDEIITVVVSD